MIDGFEREIKTKKAISGAFDKIKLVYRIFA